MATVPTDLMERKLREHYLNFIAGLGKSPKFDASMKRFIKEQVNIIESLGGKAAMAGVSNGFPAPKRLDLAPWPGKIYKSLEKTAIAAQIATGLNARDSAKAMLAAGVDTSYHRLERLARTETVHAYWQNQRAEAADLGLVLLWSAEDGKRTCKWCLERDGMVADPGASDHPNGRCTLAPTHPKMVKYIGSVDKDGNIYQNKDWDKDLGGVQQAPAKTQAGPEPTLEQQTKDTPVQYLSVTELSSRVPSQADVAKGMRKAEKERSRLFAQRKNTLRDKETTSELSAHTSYIESGYKPINALLRDDTYAKRMYDAARLRRAASETTQLDKVVQRQVLENDVILARGVKANASFNPGDMSAGDFIADKGFGSHTTNKYVAKNFAHEGPNAWTYIVKAPKGMRVTHGSDYEREIIFPRNTRQRVLKVDKKTRTIYTEVFL